MVLGQVWECHVDAAEFRESLSAFLSDADNNHAATDGIHNTVFAFVGITAVLFFFIHIVFYRLLRKWKKRWEYYECRGVEVFKK